MTMSAAQRKQHLVNIEEMNDSSPDEEKKRGCSNWSKEDNNRLVSAWLNNSNDSIDVNAKKGDFLLESGCS